QSIYPTQEIILLIAVAFVHVIGRVLWTWSLTQTTAANATVLSNLPPLFTTIGAWLFLGQSFNQRFIFGMAIALIGAFTLSLDDLWGGDAHFLVTNSAIGDGAALLSSVFYAASFLLIEKLRSKLDVQNILLWRCFLGTLLMLPIVITTNGPILPISMTGWLTVLGLAAICEALGHGLVVYSIKYFSSSFVTIVLLLEPIITGVLAWLIFAESLTLFNGLSLMLILLGIYLAKTGKGSEHE
ncbi:MAG TPA: DMT family transporter, partial [Allocoleopsis sp.]